MGSIAVVIISLLLLTLIGVGLVVTPANAQIESASNIVKGTYTNEEARIQIVFPEGWEGVEMVSAGSVITSVFADRLGADSGEEIATVIILLVSDKAQVEEPSTTRPLRVPEDAQVDCNTISTNGVEASGLAGTESVVECAADEEAFKTKTVLFETETKWITVSFIAPSEEYDENVIHYSNSLSTLQVDISIEPDGNAENDLRTTTHTVTVAGAPVDIEVKSSSTVTAFELDEVNKRISFQVDGEAGVEGRTELIIGSILEGPYIVAIDGEITGNFEVTDDERSGVAVMILSYTHSTQEIAITGTNVVPEFSVSVLGGLAAIIGLVVLLTRRNKLSNSFAKYLS